MQHSIRRHVVVSLPATNIANALTVHGNIGFFRTIKISAIGDGIAHRVARAPWDRNAAKEMIMSWHFQKSKGVSFFSARFS